VAHRYQAVIQLLAARGADVNAKNEEQRRWLPILDAARTLMAQNDIHSNA
jgi:hypothetical protein